MPRYEYECPNPKHGIFTLDRKISDRHKTAKCPKCKKISKKVIATAFPKSMSWAV
jgi:putative FmdB family regulatory protein